MEQQSEDAFCGSKASVGNSFIDVARKGGSGIWGISRGTNVYHTSSDASLFSSSLPVLSHEKLNFNSEICGQLVDGDSPAPNDIDRKHDCEDPVEEAESNTIGNLPPGDDDLLAGLMDDFDLSGLPSQLEDLEECDLFGSGGGMELDFESQENFTLGFSKLNIADNNGENGHFALPNGTATVAGEHPYGEHPSRTLFVRNINSNVEDFELRTLFEQYGDIRTLYTACKHRGFVMISYYDIRSARTAMRALQNKPIGRRKLDIHFSIPKDNPSEKDVNQGTLVVFNLDSSVTNDDLLQIFGAYGEVKEIRETPHKRHHKFIEFYDVRAAEAALMALNRSDIAGKRIKLEPSRPGGTRRNLIQQLSQELEQDETRNFRQQIGSPLSNSPPAGHWAQIGSPVENSSLHPFSKSPGLGPFSPMNSNHLSGLASILSPHLTHSAKMAPIGKDLGRVNHGNQIFNDSSLAQGTLYHNHRSFTESHFSTSPGLASSLGDSNSKPSSIGTLSGRQFLWGSTTPYSAHENSVAQPTSAVRQPFTSSGQGQGLAYMNPHTSLLGSLHHVGSAPSGGPLDRQFGYFSESPDMAFINPIAPGSRVSSLGHNNGNYMNSGIRAPLGPGVGLLGNLTENGSPSYKMMSLPRQSPIFCSNGSFLGLGEGLLERSRTRRVESSMNQLDNKKHYQLDLEKIIGGEDMRTTLMIKNIPNKYTSKMLLASIDENHRGTYDFLYLPIDFKNKCNVGYAFINMVSPKHIIPFYEAFNGKKWEKFNSEKVASLAYARIQGKAALVTHFQNSSLMNEDKRCRPILFHSEGQEISDQDVFLSSNLNICIRQQDGSYLGDPLDSPKGNLAEKR